MEHPGPESPAEKDTAQSSSQSQSSGSQNASSTANGGKPAIHQPAKPNENENAEVEAHNKDMENRHERTANQLQESDNKVNKNFWSGE